MVPTVVFFDVARQSIYSIVDFTVIRQVSVAIMANHSSYSYLPQESSIQIAIILYYFPSIIQAVHQGRPLFKLDIVLKDTNLRG